ncbi:NADP-dependent oxidoreductase [Oceanisphaera avium]|uniref:Alanine dehydrogenase n=1 Tax=Oceanisphaera avium TaxID=1903694 RepID=A0A1Y0CYF0_9GAMM|nr:NADP-dependent oxidoreductase [Oceanisphaera avium]ART80044.1 alanine dehydrogenase [Oceanisphaera avium]
MKQLMIKRFGDASQLELVEQEAPCLATNEIRVQMHFAGVNPVDAKTRAGLGWGAEAIKDQLPWTPGLEVMGTVLELGAEVSIYQEGDRVFGLLAGGGYSEQLVVPANALLRVPSAVSDETAAGLSLAGITAWQALTEHGCLKAGERVLISAAAGGVGHLAVQIAKNLGATVVALASSYNHEFLRNLGADEVLDYREQEQVSQLESVDLFIDLVGGNSGKSLLTNVKEQGRVVTVPTNTADDVINAALAKGLSATGMLKHNDNQQLANLMQAVVEQKLRVEISHVYPLAEGELAHRQIETGHTRGKVLLQG